MKRRYIGINVRTLLIRTCLPPQERNWLCQHLTILEILLVNLLKYEVFLLPRKTRHPRYKREKFSIPRPEIFLNLIATTRGLLSWIEKKLFSLLTICPKAFSYPLITFVIWIMEYLSSDPNMIVSLAYARWLIWGLHLGIPNPTYLLSRNKLLRLLDNTSTVMMNRIGDGGSSCLTPLEVGKNREIVYWWKWSTSCWREVFIPYQSKS